LSFKDGITPHVKSDHVVQLLLEGLKLVLILLRVQVAWGHWLFEEVLAVGLIKSVKKYSVEVFV
jgi:hypothetical protein